MSKAIDADELVKYLEENLEIWRHPESLDWAIGKIKRWEALDVETVVRCERCYHYDPENLLCHRYGLEKPVLMIDQGFCSCGIDKDIMEDILEKCRAEGGWCTPGYIMSSEELRSVLIKEKSNETLEQV